MQLLNTITKKAVIFFLWVLPCLSFAQPQDNSPYSRFGMGDIADDNFFALQQMGSIGASYHSPYDINIVNPASLSYLDATAFDIGVEAEYANLQDRTGDVSFWNGNLSYISLAFPLHNVLNDIWDRKQRNKSFGMAFTLKPYSKVGYDISSVTLVDGVGEVEYNYQGSGGTNDFTWSNGFRYKDFSAGLNLGYLFGRIEENRTINLADLSESNISRIEENFNYSGFLWRAGVMYTIHLNQNNDDDKNKGFSRKKFTIGLHGNTKSKLTTERSLFSGGFSLAQGIGADTLDFSESSLAGKLPAEVGAGITYHNGNKLAIGINYTATRWSGFDTALVKGNLNDTYDLSFGGFVRPSNKSSAKLFGRSVYRFGAFYRQNPVELAGNNGTTIDDVGLTLGIGLPFYYQRKISHANLGLTLGLKGRDTLVEERYMRLTFSFTFNDNEWFMKRKYN